jgi:2-amino-4-hydroxy-6-hydroxymethyldihydropteridine diphosphokinase
MSIAAYIGFGANLGDREGSFRAASRALAAVPGIAIKSLSRLYETEPVGLVDDGPAFLNAVIAVETDLSPRDLMKAMRKIELDLGKDPSHQSDWSRCIDLDLLLYDEQTIQEEGMIVPHPRMHTRAFVLLPLADVAPDAAVPFLGTCVRDLLHSLTENDLKGVRPFEA